MVLGSPVVVLGSLGVLGGPRVALDNLASHE